MPKVEEIPERMRKTWGSGTLVIPAPMEVDEYMRNVPRGKVTTINDIREALAKKHGTTIACPMTTGIFASIVACAAEERRQNGEAEGTPYWRTLKVGGVLNDKYPGGVEGQKRLLEQEGHQVVKKGKKYVVVDYKKALMKP